MEVKQRIRDENRRMKEQIVLEKQRIRDEKRRMKEQIALEKREEKQRMKERIALEKQQMREEKQRLKIEEKIRKQAFREGILMERKRQQQRAEEDNNKYEVKRQSICNMIRVAKILDAEYPEGFTASECVNKYIEMYGNINPYTLEEVSASYDISASIRGLMYETSPSSEQHWFRYGVRKIREQVAPWIFVNKELAIINNEHGWIKTNSELASARKRNKGKWKMLKEGSHAYYDWNEENYGPLPSEEVLKEASKTRKIGTRKNKVVNNVEFIIV
jgi:hypothetical protein